MSAQDEPSYLAFARANVREGLTSSPTIVRELVARIDRDAAAPKAAPPTTVTQWGVSFVHNGAFYKSYDTQEEAQAFVDEMAEVDAHLVVVAREHTPAVYSEWVKP